MSHTINRGLINKFNRGVVSKSFFAREEVDRLADSAETMTNMLPKRLGPMVLRPGTEFVLRTASGSASPATFSGMIPFVPNLEERYIMNWLNAGIKPMYNDAFLDCSDGSPSITNGDFSSSLATGWTDDDDTGCVSTVTLGELEQTGNLFGSARIYQTVTVTANVNNYFRIEVEDGPVRFRFGTAASDGTYFDEVLDEGEHWIAINENVTSCVLTISNHRRYITRVNIVEAMTTGDVEMNPQFISGWATAIDTDEFPAMQWAQSVDKLYIAAVNKRPLVITRYNEYSFGLSPYINEHGPYEPINNTNITIDSDGYIPETDLTASEELFVNAPEGFLIKYAAPGQTVTATGSDNTVETDPIQVFGSGDSRIFKVFIATTGAYASVVLERSYDGVTWIEENDYTGGGPISADYDDNLDGVDTYYRLNVQDIGSSTSITISLIFDEGIIEGHWRMRSDASSYGTATVLTGFFYERPGGSTETLDYYLGSWYYTASNPSWLGTWPSGVCFFEGRLWWGGYNKFWSTVSDNYVSFDRTVEGDSAAIEKTIGFGPAERISWMASTDFLMAGLPSAELSIRSNNFANPLTPENTNVKQFSSLGSAYLRPSLFDENVLFAQRGKKRLIRMKFDGQQAVHDDLNMFADHVLNGKIKRIEVSRTPETRIWVLTESDELWCCLSEEIENVLAWSQVSTRDGDAINDICVLPGDGEDDEIYLATLRVDPASGSSPPWAFRHIEKLGKFEEAYPSNDNYDSPNTLDNYSRHTSPGTSVDLTGQFEEDDVVGVWVDGVWDGTYTVNASDTITGITSGTDVVVGLQYTGTWKSNKLTDHGDVSSINQRQRIVSLGFVLRNYYYYADGLKYGPSTDYLRDMPELENGKAPTGGDYDFIPVPFPGENKVDPRIVLQTTFPVEVLALAYDMKNTADKTPERS